MIHSLIKNKWGIFGLLLGLGLVWGVYQTFFVTYPRWGTMPHEIKRVPLTEIWRPLKIVALPETNSMYIISRSDKVIIFKDDTLLTTVPVGHQLIPSLATDEERNRVYVTNGHENTVTLIEGISKTTTITIGGTHPEDIAIHPQTGLAYIIGKDQPDDARKVWNNHLTVLDGPNVIETLYFKQSAFHHLAVDAVNNYLYIGARKELKSAFEGEVIVLKDLQEIARFRSILPAVDMTNDPQTGDVYVLAASPDLSLFRQGALVATMQIGSGNRYPYRLALHPVTKDVYVIDFLLQEMVVIREMQEIARLPLGWDPAHMAIDPLTGNVYVANARDNTVTVINGTDLLGTIEVGWYPYGIGVNPNNGLVYVSNANENSISILGFE